MKNVKKIVEDVHKSLNDPNFETFIAQQILSSNEQSEEQPIFTISHKDMILDVWKRKNSYEIVKSVLPGAKGKDFRKHFKKKELTEEIIKTIHELIEK